MGVAKMADEEVSRRDLRRELIADLEQIEDNAKLYQAGRNSAYQAVAIQLRNLLLRGRRALLPRVIPNPEFHQLRPSRIPADKLEAFGRGRQKGDVVVVDILDVRGKLRLITGPPGAEVDLEFVDDLPLIPLENWLTQWIIRPDIAIGQLIEEVADEEVAHTQDHVGKTIARASKWSFGGAAAQRILRHLVIVALGAYVARRVRDLIGEPARAVEGKEAP